MSEQSHIDYDGLAAFIAGELDEKASLRWANWVAASAENQRIYEECALLYEPALETGSAGNFDSVAAWEKVSERIEPTHIQLTPEHARKIPQGWWKIAAAVVIAGALITMLVQQFQGNTIEFAQESGVAEYLLPDSSVVRLNGKARLAYDKDFNTSNRNVTLEGKGYFDVKRNESLQFNVSTGRGYLSVLGTAFLIEETADSLYVVVERGVVQVGLKSDEARLELSRNEAGIIQFEDGAATETIAPSLNSLYWANSKLAYRQESLANVMTELSDIFGKDIEFNRSDLSECRITAIFRDQTFEEIMENISLSFPIEYSINGDRVQIKSDGCSSN